jgi:hypothetical protein
LIQATTILKLTATKVPSPAAEVSLCLELSSRKILGIKFFLAMKQKLTKNRQLEKYFNTASPFG